MLVFVYFSNKRRLLQIESNILNERFISSVIFSFYFVLILSVIFFKGLQISSDWGGTIPMLYGPYSLPHTLSYNLIAIYSMSSILWHKYKKKFYVFFMALTSGCLIWTGVRSALLVLVIMIFCDYFSIKKVTKKIILIILGVLLFIFLLFFTGLITNNPMVQKTIVAAGKGTGVTNGRFDFYSYLWFFFVHDMSIIQKIFGVSVLALRKYMGLRYGTEIHAHNDFLNTLVGMGITGLVIYVKGLLSFCRNSDSLLKFVLVFGILFVLAFFNGLYMYLGFVPSVPVVFLYVKWLTNSEEEFGTLDDSIT